MAKRGGRRQGLPGRAYSNRTDLARNYQGQTPTRTAAAGPFSNQATPATGAPVPQEPAPNPPPNPWVGPDEVPNLTDPTDSPDQDPLAGLGEINPMPEAPYMSKLYAAYNMNPTPQLRAALNYMNRLGQ